MTTINQICKQIVTDAIDQDYLLECGSLANVYQAEYGSWRITFSPKTCKDYLQGLPSVCTVPFNNGEILEILEQHGIDVPQDADGQRKLIDAYWLACGNALYNMIR